MANWDPWTGCKKISEGCLNCYFYGKGRKKEGMAITKSPSINRPIDKKKNGDYKMLSGQTVNTCFQSDFFLAEADDWRIEAWEMIKQRPDLHFLILTKRIDRLTIHLPTDWNEGYPNVTIGVSCENQKNADRRLPILLSMPIQKRFIALSPLLEAVDLTKYLDSKIETVTVGGETAKDARMCDYQWILNLQAQCREAGVSFWFKQTGSLFQKDGLVYKIPMNKQHAQAKQAGINLTFEQKKDQ